VTQPSLLEALRAREEAYLDPYRPLPPPVTPATGSDDPAETELSRAEEPPVAGTLFLSILLLVIIGAVWVVTYAFLMDR
jgi:hypothetical protein